MDVRYHIYTEKKTYGTDIVRVCNGAVLFIDKARNTGVLIPLSKIVTIETPEGKSQTIMGIMDD